MEESKALHRLSEVADLIGMVEEMMNPQTSDRLSASAWSGMRITLRNIKDMVTASQASLATEFVSRSKNSSNGISYQQERAASPETASSAAPIVSRTTPIATANGSAITRRDLKASLEKFIDR